MQVALTRIQLRPGASLPRFCWYAARAYLQAWRDPQCTFVAVRRERPRTFWSMSAWTSREAMARYGSGGAHRRAIGVAGRFAERFDVAYWTADATPDWHDGMARMQQQCGLCASWAAPRSGRRDG